MSEERQEAPTPDEIMESGWPQVPQEEWDQPPGIVLGRIVGVIRNRREVRVAKGSGDETVFSIPQQTQFVRVQLPDGTECMERFDPQRHGEWDDIPDTGVLPPELQEQLAGFGDREVNQGQQFSNVRKRRSSRKHWKP